MESHGFFSSTLFPKKTFEILLVGSQASGKSSLIRRACEDKFFEDNCALTNEFNLLEKKYLVSNLLLVDIYSSAESRDSYIDIDAIILTVNLTDVHSAGFAMDFIMDKFKQKYPQDAKLMIAFTKLDLELKNDEQIQILDEYLKNNHKENYAGYFLTSAKNGIGVDDMLLALHDELLRCMPVNSSYVEGYSSWITLEEKTVSGIENQENVSDYNTVDDIAKNMSCMLCNVLQILKWNLKRYGLQERISFSKMVLSKK